MRALITGAGIRLGRAIALALGEAGFDIALHFHRSAAPAQALAARLHAAGRKTRLIQADLATVDGCAQTVAAAQAWGGVDVLINSAAIYESVPFAAITPARWDRMQAINCRAPCLLTAGLLDSLTASALPGGGAVVNIADIGGQRPVPGFVHYAVSKAGLIMLTRALAVELAPAVRVNAIAPGTVLPPVDMPAQTAAQIQQSVPLGRLGCAEDVAKTALFLVRDAPYITGQVLAVDGGRSITGPLPAG